MYRLDMTTDDDDRQFGLVAPHRWVVVLGIRPHSCMLVLGPGRLSCMAFTDDVQGPCCWVWAPGLHLRSPRCCGVAPVGVPSSCCASSYVGGQSLRTHLRVVVLLRRPLRVYGGAVVRGRQAVVSVRLVAVVLSPRPRWCALVMLCVVVCRGAEPLYPFARRRAGASSPPCVLVVRICAVVRGRQAVVSVHLVAVVLGPRPHWCASSCVVGQSPHTHLHVVVLVPHPHSCVLVLGIHAVVRGAEPWSAFMCWCWYVVVGACDLVVVGACRVMAGVHRHCWGDGDGDSSHSVDGPAGRSLQLLGGRSSPFMGGCGVVCGCLVSFVVWLVGILVGGPAGRSLQLLGGRSSPFAGGYGVVCGRSVSFMVW